MRGITRRRLLQGGLSAAATLSLPSSADAQALAPGISIVAGRANGLVFSSKAGPILIDAPAPEFPGAADLFANAQIAFNTNWRAEHTAANDVLGAAGKRIMAHENTRLWMTNDFTVRWEKRHYKPRADKALPNDTFYTGGRLEVGDELIEYGHLPQAHTDGDIYVFFRRANVLAVSDLLAAGRFPMIDYSTGGWIGGFRSATRRLLELTDDSTTIVPAVGAAQHRRALQAQLELCNMTWDAVGEAYVNARSLDELLALRPLDEYMDERGDPSLYLEQAYRSAWGHIRDMGLGVV